MKWENKEAYIEIVKYSGVAFKFHTHEQIQMFIQYLFSIVRQSRTLTVTLCEHV